jgi:hypothetical protein
MKYTNLGSRVAEEVRYEALDHNNRLYPSKSKVCAWYILNIFKGLYPTFCATREPKYSEFASGDEGVGEGSVSVSVNVSSNEVEWGRGRMGV